MKELYSAPEAKVICFVPMEDMAASWTSLYNEPGINPMAGGVSGDVNDGGEGQA